jgi:hypothetical protein
MKLPLNIPGRVLNNKLIFVVKKQKHNLERLEQLFDKYERLNTKKVLIIDDEADYASIGFKKDKSKEDGISANVIMTMLNNLKKKLPTFSFLQVTATPYCLYLQPNENQQLNSNVFYPNRPEITSVVPTHSKYIGGKYYFELSEDENTPANNLFIEVGDKEIKFFNKKSARKKDFEISELKVFKQSLVNYIFAGAIRCIQEENNKKRYKSSCLIHIDKKISEMNWQYLLTNEIIDKLKISFNSKSSDFQYAIEIAYLDLSNSIKKTDFYIPSFEETIELLKKCNMKCCYCSCEVHILYERVREMKQWSLDRINNDIGHNSGNLLIACLECNLKRRRTNKDAFMFTKNMVIIKEDQ